MLAAIPAHEMAETLCILAGNNAANAARHFGKQCYEAGDIATAVLWSSIAQMLGPMATPTPEEKLQPVPRRMMVQLEATAFQGAWFEDVDADVLVREALQQTLDAITEAAGGKPEATAGFHHAEYGAPEQETSERPHKLALVSANVPSPESGDAPGPRHIWSRIAKRGSSRMAA